MVLSPKLEKRWTNRRQYFSKVCFLKDTLSVMSVSSAYRSPLPYIVLLKLRPDILVFRNPHPESCSKITTTNISTMEKVLTK